MDVRDKLFALSALTVVYRCGTVKVDYQMSVHEVYYAAIHAVLREEWNQLECRLREGAHVLVRNKLEKDLDSLSRSAQWYKSPLPEICHLIVDLDLAMLPPRRTPLSVSSALRVSLDVFLALKGWKYINGIWKPPTAYDPPSTFSTHVEKGFYEVPDLVPIHPKAFADNVVGALKKI